MRRARESGPLVGLFGESSGMAPHFRSLGARLCRKRRKADGFHSEWQLLSLAVGLYKTNSRPAHHVQGTGGTMGAGPSHLPKDGTLLGGAPQLSGPSGAGRDWHRWAALVC
eukprot:352965-Chlamydomonas_euryale.AAC.15